MDGSDGGWQANIVMSCQGRGLAYETGGRVQAIPPQSGVTACNNNNNCILADVAKVKSSLT